MRTILLTIFVFLVGVIIAGQRVARADAAVVIKDGLCTLLAADGSFFPTSQSQQVNTTSTNGNSKITCHGTQPISVTRPTQTMHFNYATTGLFCYTGFGLTNEWKLTVNPNGHVSLSCHVNGNN